MKTLSYFNKLTYTLCLAGLFSTLSNPVQAQVLPDLQSRFTSYSQKTMHEKLFVHTNKSFFVAGELLWFKVYCTDASTLKLSNISKVAYVDVLDQNNQPVMQAKVNLVNGMGSGSLYIPASVSNGTYNLRGYTNWMKNFGPEYFFHKPVTLVNTLKSPEQSAKATKPDYDVQFFPEGGHLVKGCNSKVGFKVTAANGHGVVSFAGAIINTQNDTVAHFKPLKFGMGNFAFTPTANTLYKAIVKVNGTTVTQSLPVINELGYTLQATDKGTSWDITVQSTNAATETLYLLSHSRQNLKAAESGALVNGIAHFIVNKSQLDDGVNYFTLFNSKKQPLCERLVFKRPNQKLLINAQTGSLVFEPRKKVELGFATQNQNNKNVPANLSVSVYQLDSLQLPDTHSIHAYLWLGADIKGSIESADYYFDSPNAEADEALDNLLLSQGWRSFDWDKVFANKPTFSFIPEYTGHVITTKIVNTLTGKPAQGIISYLSVPGTRTQLFAAISDSSGRQLFNTHDFYGLNEVVVQTNAQQDSTYRIDVQSPFAEMYADAPQPEFKITGNMQKELEAHHVDMQVENVYAAPQLRKFYDPMADSTAFYGQPAKTYLLDDYTRFTTMEEVVREYVSGVTLTRPKNRFKIRMFDAQTGLDGEPLVLLDGIPVFDANKIFSVDPLKIKKLEVINTRYFYGPIALDGVMNFTSYKGDMAGYEIDPKAVVMDYEGLQLQRKFYSPVYDTEQQRQSRLPDARTALFWKPDALTNNQGQGTVSFYTSDKAGKYVVIVQGITADGEAGSRQIAFEVKKQGL